MFATAHGLLQVPVGDQPSDIETRIRNMVLEYIRHPTCVILAVSAANHDLVNSDALELARSADPDGHRTIGACWQQLYGRSSKGPSVPLPQLSSGGSIGLVGLLLKGIVTRIRCQLYLLSKGGEGGGCCERHTCGCEGLAETWVLLC